MGSMQTESQLLNYLTAPNVLVWSAVLASCAIPLVFEGVELMQKTKSGETIPYMASQENNKYIYIDGSVS